MIETARLHLIPATEADVDTLHRIWTDPDVRRYLWDDIIIDRDIATAVLAHSANDWRERGYGIWLIVERETNTVAGFTGFRSSEDRPEPELVFGLLPAFWHRGLATEAARAAVDFLDGRAIWAATDPENTASMQVLERLGMTVERRAELVYYVSTSSS